MSIPIISLFASAVRIPLFNFFLDSLSKENIIIEVIFCGNAKGFSNVGEIHTYHKANVIFKYITSNNIKPSQAYEAARIECSGEVIVWVADDAEFKNNILTKAYNYWKSQNNKKLILSLQTWETGYNTPDGILCDMNQHRFFGFDENSPLMAPIGMMSREYLNELGGLDRRYICGQYENDITMRVLSDGGKVEIFGDKESYVEIDHLKKSKMIGESTDMADFLQRPFAKGYKHDRNTLLASWTTFNKDKMIKALRDNKYTKMNDYRNISPIRLDAFEPYENKDILIKSQSYRGVWE